MSSLDVPWDVAKMVLAAMITLAGAWFVLFRKSLGHSTTSAMSDVRHAFDVALSEVKADLRLLRQELVSQDTLIGDKLMRIESSVAELSEMRADLTGLKVDLAGVRGDLSVVKANVAGLQEGVRHERRAAGGSR